MDAIQSMDVDIAKVQSGIDAALKALPLKQASDWRPRTPASNLIVPTPDELEERKDVGMFEQTENEPATDQPHL